MTIEKKRDLLIELGSEELPAGFVARSVNALEKSITEALKKERLAFDGTRTFSTPRRLCVIIEGLQEKQDSFELEERGPNIKAAYDGDKNPTKALLGFAKGKGVTPADLTTIKTDKGEYILFIRKVKGQKTEKVLPGLLAKAAGDLNFPKSMRWASNELIYARPLHWIVALYGEKVVKFSLGHIKSGQKTCSHRYPLGRKIKSGTSPDIKVESATKYEKTLEACGVMASPTKRLEVIEAGLLKEAKDAGGKIVEDKSLLEEVVNLVEWPVLVRGSFEDIFLELPREVVTSAMREHQRYFSIEDKDGSLLPYFVTIANTAVKDTSVVREGNERVLRARLNDAKFYFDKDLKVELRDWVNGLKGVVFQAKLGTSYEKVLRFTELAVLIGQRSGFYSDSLEFNMEDFFNPLSEEISKDSPSALRYRVGRSAALAKADLLSGMVYEFPHLQGVMGQEYALRAGEDKVIASAIFEHYMPLSAGGELPKTEVGSIVSIADKLDTIAGCFGVGLIPTGTSDPYALRRSALGIIAIITKRGYSLRIDELVKEAVSLLGSKITKEAGKVEDEVLDFIKERLRNQLLSGKTPLSYDAVDAVLSATWFDLNDAIKRIKAIENFKAHPACQSLTETFKRVANILKGQVVEGGIDDIDPSLFTEPSEKRLWEVRSDTAPVIEKEWKSGAYESAFETLASLKDSIDVFFDDVMVMVDDEQVKKNRLLLLSSLISLYSQIADISKLQSEGAK